MSALLETAIGIVFTFLLVSLLVTAFTELLASWTRWRASNLWTALDTMLGEASTKTLKAHPAISTLLTPNSLGWMSNIGLGPNSGGPQYVPTKMFSTAVLDLVLKGAATPGGSADGASASPPPAASVDLLDRIEALTGVDKKLKDALGAFARQHGNDVERFRAEVENWFDAMMEPVSGWYKRKTQAMNFFAALLLAGAMDIDSVRIARVLWTDGALRQAIVAEAESVARQPTPPVAEGATPEAKLSYWTARMTQLRLPIGRCAEADVPKTPADPKNPGIWWCERAEPIKVLGKDLPLNSRPGMLFGWLITALAASLGAPFWFDLLRKFVNIRGAGAAETPAPAPKPAAAPPAAPPSTPPVTPPVTPAPLSPAFTQAIADAVKQAVAAAAPPVKPPVTPSPNPSGT